MIAAIWNRQPLEVNILPSTRPRGRDGLSGVGWFVIGTSRGSFYVNIDEKTYDKIVVHMPLGISLEYPCHLYVVTYHSGYRIYCKYLHKPATIYLWRQGEDVSWVKNVNYREG